MKSAVEEIDFLRHQFQTAVAAYRSAVEAEIAKLREAASVEAAKKTHSAARLRDARDIVTVIRTLEIKAEKGRRRDLKKIEAVLEDLKGIVEHWQA